MKRCEKVILNNTDSQTTQWENELGSLGSCNVASTIEINQRHQQVTSTNGINPWSQMQES